ncbi:MAG: FtsW/RodA/SpoVE family cell cycle protein [Chloroflexota bacterium]
MAQSPPGYSQQQSSRYDVPAEALTLENAQDTRFRLTPDALILAIAGIFLLTNTAALALVRGGISPRDIAIVVVWATCALIGRRLLVTRLRQPDVLLFSLAMFLSGWGLVLINRLAAPFAERQTLWLVIAVAGLLLVALTPRTLRLLRSFRYTLLVAGLALLASTIIFGENPSGLPAAPELWLRFGDIYLQPSEPLKIVLVVFLASYLAEQYPALRAEGIDTHLRRIAMSPRVFGPILLMWSLSIVFLVWQRDLGAAILFFAVFTILLYVASGSALIVLSGAALIVFAGLVGYFAFDVVRLRVDVWLHPWPEAGGRAYQIVQSLMAFAAGGPFGQGIGQGLPTFIPVVHSDFAFAAIAEEWGLLGVITLIACIAVLVTRGLKLALFQRGRPFNALLAVGLSAILATQSLLIMGGVLKLVPLTGVTLPFLSYGGSSLVTNFVLVGLLIRISVSEAA